MQHIKVLQNLLAESFWKAFTAFPCPFLVLAIAFLFLGQKLGGVK